MTDEAYSEALDTAQKDFEDFDPDNIDENDDTQVDALQQYNEHLTQLLDDIPTRDAWEALLASMTSDTQEKVAELEVAQQTLHVCETTYHEGQRGLKDAEQNWTQAKADILYEESRMKKTLPTNASNNPKTTPTI